ncbi:pentatricopeptide repeat-containing protein At3g18970 [Mercurialis annua]|uniref:pentatricopeptide repeat-containing protein At3g18970 n=1 Tax=Mercurialis annua TaxID=3986 RepID=UPI00215F0B04|nr:pentatricopeptide repeat-containing protein At3g18970 [Mercurialis annua]
MYELPRIKCIPLLYLKLINQHQPNQILAQLITNNLKSPTFLSKLIEQYCSLSNPHKPRLIFTHFHHPNLFLLNTLIRCTKPQDSIQIFSTWASKDLLVFDDFTYLYVLGACARLPSLSCLCLGRQIQTQVLKFGFMSNSLVSTTLIHFYANNRDVSSGRKVFDEMSNRSVVTWNAMITGYSSQREKGKDCAFNAILLFREMVRDVCGENPNDTTMVSVLSACSQVGMLELGDCIHGYIEKIICKPEDDVFIGTGLVDMYSKCGNLDGALNLFSKMKIKNVLTWTAMATGLAIHGKGKETLELLYVMLKSDVKPNVVTYTSLLSACCHSGLVDEGLQLFHSMKENGIEPRVPHYGCVVDLLGRAGHLKEAYEFIIGMPVKPDDILWRCLLSACKVHGDAVLGEKVAKILLHSQQQKNSANLDDASEDYVALSNVYASAARWDDVEMLRKEMKTKRIETKPGSSFV